MEAGGMGYESVSLLGMGHEGMRGPDKYTGAVVGDDGAVYAVPGSAPCVLRVDPRTLAVTTLPVRPEHCRNELRKGKFKWLRGIAAADPKLPGPSAAIYCIPCNAHAVLKIVPRAGEVMPLTSWTDPRTGTVRANPVLRGTFKWHGGVLAADGNIYCVPANAARVLMIVPSTGEVRLVGPTLLPELGERSGGPGPLDVAGRWYGGLLGSDGAIYGMPCNADCVLKISPQQAPSAAAAAAATTTEGAGRPCAISSPPDPVVTTLPVPFLGLGGWDYHGGVATEGGQVLFAVPMHAQRVLAVIPETGDVFLVGDASAASSTPAAATDTAAALQAQATVGAGRGERTAYSPAPRVWTAPLPEDRDRAGPRGSPSLWRAGRYQFGGAIRSPLDGRSAYLLPYDALEVVKVTAPPWPPPPHAGEGGAGRLPAGEAWGTATALPVYDHRGDAEPPGSSSATDFRCPNKWQNGFVGRDGKCYAIPVSAPAILRIDPATDRVDTIGREACATAGIYDKWEGGAVAPFDGALYCVPQCACAVLRISL